MTLGLLFFGVAGQTTAVAESSDEHHSPGCGERKLVLIDNSNADSWLEIDRTLNFQLFSDGSTSGSDHDGSAVDLMDTLVNPDHERDDDPAW